VVMKNCRETLSIEGKADAKSFDFEHNLATIRPRSRISHRQKASNYMLPFKILVLKFFTINRFAASSISIRKITALTHEILDNAMECTPLQQSKEPCINQCKIVSVANYLEIKSLP
jgi:hypothetical protein